MEKNEIEIEVNNEISKTEYFSYYNGQTNINKPKLLYITPEMIKYVLIIKKSEEDEIIIAINSKNINEVSQYQTHLV